MDRAGEEAKRATGTGQQGEARRRVGGEPGGKRQTTQVALRLAIEKRRSDGRRGDQLRERWGCGRGETERDDREEPRGTDGASP